MSKWTPGPWRVHKMPKEEGWEIRAELHSDPRFGIGVVNVYPLLRAGGHSEAKANAHLISAAPEMYEALEQCLEVLPEGDCQYTRRLVQTVLAKARGES